MSLLDRPDAVNDLLAEYHGTIPPALTTDESDWLMAAILMELQAQRLSGDGPEDLSVFLERQQRAIEGSDDTTAVYRSFTKGVDATGWEEVDLEFVSSEVDLRFDKGIEVAFADPSNAENIIQYDQSRSPVTEIPVRTGHIWLRSQSGTATVEMEVWS